MVDLLLNAGAKLRLGKQSRLLLPLAANYGYLGIAQRLIATGADVNERDSEGNTALMAAAGAGQAAVVKLLLEKGAHVNAKNVRGETALSQAAIYGRVAAAKVLLEKGADANARDSDGGSLISSAIVSSMDEEDASFVKLLLDHGANPNGPAGQETPLMWAAKTGARRAVELLLEKGADAKATADSNETALLNVLQEGNLQRAQMALYGFGGVLTEDKKREIRQKAQADDTAIVQALLNHGVDVTQGANRYALIEASAAGITPIVQLLLEHGAPVDGGDRERVTPMMQMTLNFAKNNPKEAAQILAEGRKSGDFPLGLTPLLAAAKNGHPESVRLLLERGANVQARDREGTTALMYVAKFGRHEIARHLPQMREGVLHRANEGAEKPMSSQVSPKEKAQWQKWASEGDSAIISALSEHQADAKARDGMGNTALMLAAMQSSPDVVRLLIQAKTDVNAHDKMGRTALMLVAGNGRIQQAPTLYSQELQMSVQTMERYQQRGWGDKKTQGAELAKAKAALSGHKAAVIKDATEGDTAVIRLLRAAGADVNIRDQKNRTARVIAQKAHHEVIAALLQ